MVRDALHNFQIDYRKWLNLLGSFTKITLPLQIQPNPEGEVATADNPYTLKNLLEPREVDIRDQETRNGNYLSHLRLYFDDVVKPQGKQ